MNRQVDVKALVSHIVRGDGLDKCRICMGDTSQGQVHLSDTVMMDGDKPVTLSELLEVITGVEMESTPRLPSRACQDCSSAIAEFLPFLKLCRESAHQWNIIAEHLEKISVNKKSTTAYVLFDGEPKTVADRSDRNKTPKQVLRNMKSRLRYVRYGKSRLERKIKNRRIERKYNNFACPDCKKGFQELARFNKHIRNIKKQCCEHCFSIVDTKSFGKHLLSHDITSFTCGICFLHFESEDRLIRHTTIHNNGKFMCPECKMTFPTSDRQTLHTSIRHATIRCVCNQIFSNKGCYHTHRRTCGEKQKRKYTCDHCSKQFNNRTVIVSHLRYFHGKKKPYQCDQCGKQFNNRVQLGEHGNSHNKVLDRFSCEYCGQNYSTRRGYRKHMKNKHYDVDPELYKKARYQCHMCDKSLISEGNLRKHLIAKHKFKL